MSATDGMIELVAESLTETFYGEGSAMTAEQIAARVVDYLKKSTNTAGLVGYVIAGGQVREIKVIEHETEHEDERGRYTAWNLGTYNEESAE